MAKPIQDQIGDALKEGLLKAKTNARVEDLVEAATIRFGGIGKVADRMVTLYDTAKAGGIVQAKVLESYVRMLQMVGKKDPPAPLDQQSDADLERRAMQLFKQFVQSVKIEESTDATPPPKPAD